MAAPAVPATSTLAAKPTAFIGGIVTLLTGVVFAVPDLGIALPTSVVKIITIAVMLAGYAGIHSKVTPVVAPKDNKGNVLIPKPDILHQP